MRWHVKKSRYPARPDRPWYAATTLPAALGLGHSFPSWRDAYTYAYRRATYQHAVDEVGR